MRNPYQRVLFLAPILVLFSVSLRADVVAPGGSVSPDVFPDPGNPPLLNSGNGTFDFGSGSGEITGTYTSDDLLGAIFSSFCIGK